MKPGKRRWASIRFRHRIRNVLLTYYLTPILLILLASGAFFYYSAKRSLDDELGQRLTSVALAASSQLRPFQISALELRDPSNLTYDMIRSRFEKIRTDHKAEKVYLFTMKDESLVDTDRSVSIGSIYERNRLNLAELDRVRKGAVVSSVLFQGSSGVFYKSAFAPVKEDDNVVAIVGVDGSATFFANLHRLGRQLAYFTLACVGVIVLVSMMISRKIVTPIQLLRDAAQRMGEGHLGDPIDIRSQNEIGFLGFVLDEMRKNIIARDRELQMMLRGIAHEVRNPLGGMELFAGILQEEVTEPQAQEAVKKIQREIRTLQNLVEEFLDFARGPSIQMADVELKSFFGDVRLAFQKDMENRGVQLDLNLDGVQAAKFDPDQMRRVFLNLVRNSIQAMPQGGRIEVKAGSGPSQQVEFSVADDGPGIPAENLEKLFDPFFTTKEQGTGLGLSFARKIVNAHGGEIQVDSQPGTGTTVTISLPRE